MLKFHNPYLKNNQISTHWLTFGFHSILCFPDQPHGIFLHLDLVFFYLQLQYPLASYEHYQATTEHNYIQCNHQNLQT